MIWLFEDKSTHKSRIIQPLEAKIRLFLQTEQLLQPIYWFRNLAAIFQLAAIEGVFGFSIMGQSAFQSFVDESAKLFLRLSLEDGTLLGGHPQAAEQYIGIYVYSMLSKKQGVPPPTEMTTSSNSPASCSMLRSNWRKPSSPRSAKSWGIVLWKRSSIYQSRSINSNFSWRAKALPKVVLPAPI